MTNSCSKAFILLVLILVSCTNKKTRQEYNSVAVSLNNKAVSFISQNQFDSALIYSDEAIEVDSTYYVAYENKAVAFYGLNAINKALKQAETAVYIKPDFAEGWMMVGMLNDKTGDTAQARSSYKKSIKLYESRITQDIERNKLEANTLNKAVALILYGDTITAKKVLGRLKEINPDDLLADSLLLIDRNVLVNQFLKH